MFTEMHGDDRQQMTNNAQQTSSYEALERVLFRRISGIGRIGFHRAAARWDLDDHKAIGPKGTVICYF
ncbi:hypothetical protein T265_16081, partial [Opisthorchis viverrini]